MNGVRRKARSTLPISAEFLAYVIEQLGGLPDLVPRRMFGGVGLYSGLVFFGIVWADALYLKVGDGNRADYLARGMRQFNPFPDRSRVGMSYFEVPADVLEDRDVCGTWARRSVEVAALGNPHRRRTR
jgi:DNA transformation protein